ncbi:MAG: transglutaminase domain-containing protein [Oscillospiraceae bacterium]|jgi:hypothetical protein
MRTAVKITSVILIIALAACCYFFLPEDLTSHGIEASQFPELTKYEEGTGILRDSLGYYEKILYDAVLEGLKNYDEQVVVRIKNYTSEQVSEVLQDVILDHPEIFWADLSGFYYMTGDMGVKVTLAYSVAESDLDSRKQSFDEALNELVAAADGSETPYEKVLAVHDALLQSCEYDLTTSEDDIHNAYGALVNRLAVCDGYADAMKCALDKLGIECRIIAGDALNGKGESVGHAWCEVKIGGAYTFIDPTWDDMDSAGGQRAIASSAAVSHRYFGLSTAEIALDHTSQQDMSGSAAIPEGFSMSWYQHTGSEGSSIDDIAECAAQQLFDNLTEGKSWFEVRITDSDEYSTLYKDEGFYEIIDIANEKLSASGSTDSFSYSARFYLLSDELGCILCVCSLEGVDLAA